jgi:aminoglycoside 2'-N-acetyltransferase I
MKDDLQIEILHLDRISAELDKQIDALEHLAFSGEIHDTDFKSIQWASHDWMALGRLDGELVTQFCLLKREITVGGEKVWVTGIGGVATHPNWRRRGLASQLLLASEAFMRAEIRTPFGLLICADETQPVYSRCGWQTIAKSLIFVQDDQHRKLDTCVMILPLVSQPWPTGEINLCGLPW